MKFKKILLGVCVLLMSCNESSKETSKEYNDFSEKRLVENIIDTYVLPQQENFVKEVEVLKKATGEFVTNTTESNLLILQDKWKKLAKSWSRSYTFNIGTIKKDGYLQKLALYPIGNENLEKFIDSPVEISLTDFNQREASTMGIMSLGYLLHSNRFSANNIDASTIVLEFKNSVNRKKVLGYLVDRILEDTRKLNQDWIVYAKYLKNNETKQGAIESSFSLLFNGLNNVINYAWETKVASPSGLGNNNLNAKKLEAPYSKYSLELLKENIKYTKKIFFSENGISNRVKFITKNDDLVDKVKSQYETVESTLNAFDHSLYDSLTDDYEKVKKLEQELKKLQVLFKVDITSTLSLVNTGTDGDGD